MGGGGSALLQCQTEAGKPADLSDLVDADLNMMKGEIKRLRSGSDLVYNLLCCFRPCSRVAPAERCIK